MEKSAQDVYSADLAGLNATEEPERSRAVEAVEVQANNGSETSQLLLGQHYLKRAETESALLENSTKAVEWLVKASTQGNKKATEILRECLENQIGVADNNVRDVSWCISTPEFEKRALNAAKRLFSKLVFISQESESHQDMLTKQEFNTAVSLLGKDKNERKLLAKVGKIDEKEVITEEYFVRRMMKKLHGQGGMLEKVLKTDIEWEAYLNSTTIQKLTKYPGMTLARIADHTVETAGSRGMYWLKSLVPTNQIYMLIIFFIYSLLSMNLIMWFIPLFLFYTALSTMVICTMQMFYSKRKLRDVKAVAEMLNKFQDTLNSDHATSAYSWNSITPYVTFFVALIMTVLTFSISDKAWIPCAELVTISALFTVACFYALSDQFEFLALLSIILDNISTLPAIIDGFPRIPVVYHIVYLFAGTLYSWELFPNLCLNFGLPSVAYLLVPLLFIRMAMRESWKGTYRVLLPHMVCFFWWRLAVLFFGHSTWVGLVRASLGWGLFIILLPIITLVIFIGGLIYLINMFTFSNAMKIMTTVFLLGIPAAFALWAQQGFKLKGIRLSGLLGIKTRTTKIVLLLLFVISSVPTLFVFMPDGQPSFGVHLTWEQYRDHCSKPQWDKANIASAMVSCSHLTGAMVDWTGTVKKIVVKKTDNEAEAFMNKLPHMFANWLKCVYGEEYSPCDTKDNSTARDMCKQHVSYVGVHQKRMCHLKNLNRYTFEMWVKMPIDLDNVQDIRVEASHRFGDTLSKIQDGNEVRFVAALVSDVGNVWPVMRLYQIECNTCEEPIKFGGNNILEETWHIVMPLVEAMQRVWNFFVSPVIEFRSGQD